MVELRKRKAPAAPPPPAKKSKTPATSRAKATAEETKTADAPAAKKAAPQVGDTVALDGFGGEIETDDGEKTTLKALVDASKSGVVLFTYPKASTPGCT